MDDRRRKMAAAASTSSLHNLRNHTKESGPSQPEHEAAPSEDLLRPQGLMSSQQNSKLTYMLGSIGADLKRSDENAGALHGPPEISQFDEPVNIQNKMSPLNAMKAIEIPFGRSVTTRGVKLAHDCICTKLRD